MGNELMTQMNDRENMRSTLKEDVAHRNELCSHPYIKI